MLVLPAPGRSHNVPSVARGRSGVNDDRADRAPPGRFFVLVGPSPVIRECAARKKLGIVGRGLVRKQDDNLTTDVGVAIVIPIVLRSCDAMTYENRRRI